MSMEAALMTLLKISLRTSCSQRMCLFFGNQNKLQLLVKQEALEEILYQLSLLGKVSRQPERSLLEE